MRIILAAACPQVTLFRGIALSFQPAGPVTRGASTPELTLVDQPCAVHGQDLVSMNRRNIHRSHAETRSNPANSPDRRALDRDDGCRGGRRHRRGAESRLRSSRSDGRLTKIRQARAFANGLADRLGPAYARMAWQENPAALQAWQRGRTGVPIVDAGMRQLWHTGWMHNRVRMITASFLVKHLLTSWVEGERWFWDTLVDGDLAANAASWQWIAGCGLDSQPFFRVFNPVAQGEKFDPAGAYVRRWVPELARLPDKHVHAPWDAPASVLTAAGVTLGRDYPHPIVELSAGRDRALAAFRAMRAAA